MDKQLVLVRIFRQTDGKPVFLLYKAVERIKPEGG